MLTLSCGQVRADLSAFHDGELPVADRIAIADHLEACASCRVEASDLAAISESLRATARTEDVAVMPSLNRLQADMLERWDAEEKASIGQAIRRLFDDPRRASASVGVSVVASLCLVFAAFVVAQSPIRHPESLKAVMTQGERARLVDIYLPETSIPRADAETVMPATVINRDRGEEVAFAALVTADGYLEKLEYLGERSDGRRSPPATHEQLVNLLNAAATARFEPARSGGYPVSFNVVWLVAHTTVRAPLRAYVHVRVDGWKAL
ncbi:MAG TPA: zf-HC2 domain-containing protein [Vicinamibacterales bacterium]|nr:zf-HC2 domain-containing protein [Vicinamibacterales bacterium]